MLPVGSGLEGERIRLRPLELADAERMQGWINDPEIRRYIGGIDYQYSLPAEEDYIRGMQQNDWEHGLHFAIETTDTGEPGHIGSVDLRNLHAEARSGEIGIMIGAREYWDRGYGTDVVRTICRFGFEDLDLHRIELTVAAYNPRAQRVYENVGFVVEGRMREHRYIAGRYHDTLVMGLLRRDFEAREAERR
jgi:RimJ/RimL family protein N-acetyltransferase